MAKAPKELTQKAKLEKLKSLNIVGDSAKTFGKTASRLWAEFTTAFPKGTAGNQTFIKASKAAIKACDSVNMRTIGGAVVFPSGSNGTAKIRETKHGVFIDYGPKNARKGKLDTIILSKDGNHIKYGMKLARRESLRADPDLELTAWGTLKTHAFNTKKNGSGEMVRGFMRDVAVSHQNPEDALYDNRYGGGLTIDPHALTDKFVAELAQTNGTAAMIRVRY